jgi:ribonuclease HI
MSLISWNCRGLGNLRTVRDLNQMVKDKKPNFLFLIETISSKKRMEGLRVRLGFEGLFVVEPVGRSGGLALFWKNMDDLEIQNYSRRHINAIVRPVEGGIPWKFTGFYGHPDPSKRSESWSLLSLLKSFAPMPWLCVGDFNEITHQAEKSGASRRREGQMEAFRNALDDCHLGDLGFTGPRFTWSNKRHDDNFTQERLDRAVGNSGWCDAHKSAGVEVLAARASDHHPIMVIFNTHQRRCIRGRRGFKFEASWLPDEEYGPIVDEVWEHTDIGVSAMMKVRCKLERCQSKLKWWSREKFGKNEDIVKEKSQALAEIQNMEGPAQNENIRVLQKEIDTLLEFEDTRWKQRAKQSWYRDGDRNTPFFHAWASHRRRVNTIKRVADAEERVWTKEEDIGGAFVSYYKQLFTSEGTEGKDEFLEGMQARVTRSMNAKLIRRFEECEVDRALAQMHPLKSPGPDGFSACFYQHSWSTVRKDVCQAVLDFLNNGHFDEAINVTNIALIPKKKKPTRVTEFRPISLCNVIYKLIAKVLANRLKGVLGDIISPNQSAFIPGRLITDNVLIAFEALHTMDSRLSGKEGYMALKLDMRKAYDRVEWDFLEVIMRRLGFDEKWIFLVMKCVRTVKYAVLINGQAYGEIIPSRGLRQGDPLSPYFFILCAEGLSAALRKGENEGRFTGLPITRGGTKLNHLFFADDSLLFCKATETELKGLLDILDFYEQASGQQLNKEKTAIFFSRNTKTDVRVNLSHFIGVPPTQNYETYLGLPALVGRSRFRSFEGLKGRIWDKMHGWKEKFLSQAGKEVLLKSVVQAIPTYTMSVFQLPKTLCRDINSMMSKFWWGHKDNDKKIAWMSWAKMGRAKETGGLGYRDLECFNLAMLAKQGWRIIQHPDSLVAKIMKEKYFPNSNFMDTHLGRKPSYAWRSIWNAKPLLREGLVWRVGDGKSIHIWGDKWLPTKNTHEVQSHIRIVDGGAKVCALIDDDTRWWNIPLVEAIFNVEESRIICSLPICPGSQVDKMVWGAAKNGQFTVRSAYHVAKEIGERYIGGSSEERSNTSLWKRIWKLDGPKVVKLFIWQACNNILPTYENLFKRKVVSDALCPICKGDIETVGHALWSCPAAQDVWHECPRKIQKSTSDQTSFLDIFEGLLNRLDDEEMDLVASTARQVWLRRNQWVFDAKFLAPTHVVQRAADQLESAKKCGSGTRTTRQQERAPSGPRVSEKWKVPPWGFLKCNWDAALDVHGHMMGIGILVRDHEGMVVAAKCTTQRMINDPLNAETIAAWAAACFIRLKGFDKIILEGDSMGVVQSLTGDAQCWAQAGQLIDDTKRILYDCSSWKVQHVHREANTAADRLAKTALQLVEEHQWIASTPLCIQNIVMFDRQFIE